MTKQAHLTTEDFDYDLPQELIAQTPLEKRDHSRMLVLDSKTGEMKDDVFYNVIDQIKSKRTQLINIP